MQANIGDQAKKVFHVLVEQIIFVDKETDGEETDETDEHNDVVLIEDKNEAPMDEDQSTTAGADDALWMYGECLNDFAKAVKEKRDVDAGKLFYEIRQISSKMAS
jgi:hypothetical protein